MTKSLDLRNFQMSSRVSDFDLSRSLRPLLSVILSVLLSVILNHSEMNKSLDLRNFQMSSRVCGDKV